MKKTLCLLILSLVVACTQQQRYSTLYKITENGKVGYIDTSGKVVIPAVYWAGSDFDEGMAAVRENGLYGFIDEKGRYVIAPQYDYALRFNKGVAMVGKEGKRYFINRKGKVIFSGNYSSFGMESRERAIVETETGMNGVLDIPSGKLILDTIYSNIFTTPAGGYIVSQRAFKVEAVALMDGNGKVLVPFGKYDKINSFNEGYAIVSRFELLEDKGEFPAFGVIDEKGKEVLKLPANKRFYILMSDGYHNGYVKVLRNNGRKEYSGYMDLKGKLVLDDSTYSEDGTGFIDGRAILYKESGGYRVIDQNLQPVNFPQFEKVEGFCNGNTIVRTKDMKSAVVDTNGHYLLKPDYYNFRRIDQSNYFYFKRWYPTEGSGIMDLKGRVLCKDLKNEYVDFFDGIFHAVLKNEQLVYVDTSGKVIWRKDTASEKKLWSLNIDFMSPTYYYADTLRKIMGGSFPLNQLAVTIDTTRIDTFGKLFVGYKMYVSNTTGNTIRFDVEDNRLDLKLQAQNSKGEWKDIEHQFHSWCGNSYYTMDMENNAYWSFTIPCYEGSIPVKIRGVLAYKDRKVYSNVMNGSINPAQWWNVLDYFSSDIMNPYRKL